MIYVLIDEGYSVERLQNMKEILSFCHDNDLVSVEGNEITKEHLRKSFSNVHGYLNLYEYSEEELEDASENGYASKTDWKYKITRI